VSLDPDFKILAEMAERYRNWGKWGPDDQVGTVNYITPDKVRQSARLVQKGEIFSLAIPMDGNGPQSGTMRRHNPMCFMLRDGRDTVAGVDPTGMPQGYGAADDVLMTPTHAATHWDGLGHIHWDGKMWNGYDSSLVSSFGAEKNGVENYNGRIASRGVLLDVARAKGVPWLEIGYPITSEDLEEAAHLAKVEVQTGDIVLIRTGHITYCRDQKSWGSYAMGDAAGLSLWTCEWIQERQVAGVATDTWGVEVRPNELKWVRQPWHHVVLPNMGLLVGEIFELAALAEACAADGVYEFQLVSASLPITGGVGSPTGPIAIK